MRKKMKRCLSLVMTFLMILVTVPLPKLDVFAAEEYGIWIGTEQFTSDKLTINGKEGYATYDPENWALTFYNFRNYQATHTVQHKNYLFYMDDTKDVTSINIYGTAVFSSTADDVCGMGADGVWVYFEKNSDLTFNTSNTAIDMPNNDLRAQGSLKVNLDLPASLASEAVNAVNVSEFWAEEEASTQINIKNTHAVDNTGYSTGLRCATGIINLGSLYIRADDPVKSGMCLTKVGALYSLSGSVTILVRGNDSVGIGAASLSEAFGEVDLAGHVFAHGDKYGIYTEHTIALTEGYYIKQPEDGVISPDGHSILDSEGNIAATVEIDKETPYNIWVGDTQVTPTNRKNIPGVTGGTASYDPKTFTLKFSGGTCGISGLHNGAMIETTEGILNIEGDAELYNPEATEGIRMEDTTEDQCLSIYGNVQITAKNRAVNAEHKDLVVYGKLKTDVTKAGVGSSIICRNLTVHPYAEVDAASEDAVLAVIYVREDMFIDHGSVKAEGSALINTFVNGNLSVESGYLSAENSTLPALSVNNNATINNSFVELSTTAQSSQSAAVMKDLNIANSTMKVAAATDLGLNCNALSMNNSDISVSASKNAVKCKALTMKTGKFAATGGEQAIVCEGTINLKDGVSIVTPAGGTVKGNTIVESDGITPAKNVLIDGGTWYSIWVGGTQISDKNADNIPVAEGSARYDRTSRTLIFEDAALSATYEKAGVTAMIYADEDLAIDGDLVLRGDANKPAACGIFVDGDHELEIEGSVVGLQDIGTLIMGEYVRVSGSVESYKGQAVSAHDLYVVGGTLLADDKGENGGSVVLVYNDCRLTDSMMSVTVSGAASIPVDVYGALVLDEADLNIRKESDGNYCLYAKRDVLLKDGGSISIVSSGKNVTGLENTGFEMGIASFSIDLSGEGSAAVDSENDDIGIECGKFTARSEGECVRVKGFYTLGANVTLEGGGTALFTDEINMEGGILKANNKKNNKQGAIYADTKLSTSEDIELIKPAGGSIGNYGIYDAKGDPADEVVLKSTKAGAAETWNLFESSTASFSISGLYSGMYNVTNSNKKSEKYYEAVLSGSTINVKVREGADRKAAAKPANAVLEFELNNGSVVTYTMNVEYVQPQLKLASNSVTIREGVPNIVMTQVLVKTEYGNFVPYDLSGLNVSYGSIYAGGGMYGMVNFTTSEAGKGAKLKISAPGWDKPVELKFNVKAVKKDVISIMGNTKNLILNTNIWGQSYNLPVSLNGVAADPSTVEIVKGSEVAEITSAGYLVISTAKMPAVGNYTVTLQQKGGSAKASVKVRVSNKALDQALSFKVQSKYDVVTGQKMLLVLSSKDANTSVYNYSIVEAPAGASVASDGYGNCLMDFSACGLSASNLNIGDIRIKAVLYGGEEATITVKGVKAKATKPTVRIAPMKVFKEVTATVKASTNAVCTYKTADGHIHAIEPEKYVAAAAKGADIQQNPMSESEFLTYNMSKNSGSVKVTLTFAGGLQKTVTVKAKIGKANRS